MTARGQRKPSKPSESKSSAPQPSTSVTVRPPSRHQRKIQAKARAPQLRYAAIAGAVALIAGGALVAWLLLRDDGAGSGGSGPRPIATLDAPDIHSLLIDPTNPDRVLFGSHAGTQESLDGGFSWSSGSLRGADAMSLAASGQAPETLYAAGHNVFQVSRDGGQTWSPVAHNLPGTDIHGFAQDPVDPLRLFAVVAGAGTFTSADGGTTWTPLPAQPSEGGMMVMLASNGSALYAATGTTIVASSDLGATWTPLPAQPAGQVLSLAIPEGNPQMIYAGTVGGLEVSLDGGATWTAHGPAGVPVLTLAVAPADPNRVLFVSQDGGVYRSDDGGATWRSPA